jgi:hypothetical protein
MNRAQRRAAASHNRRMRNAWLNHCRRFPRVDVDAPELPGRKYNFCYHHREGCAAFRGVQFVNEQDCDCDPVVTKHLEPLQQ